MPRAGLSRDDVAAALQASNGFQWSGDPDETFDWMIGFIDRGLQAIGTPAGS